MAFGLAVYASPRGLPRFDARLASSRWSDATGRAFHPQGSNERFQRTSLHLILLPQALLGAITSTYAPGNRWLKRLGSAAQFDALRAGRRAGTAKKGPACSHTKVLCARVDAVG